MKKEHPILFSAPMVRAILNGTKTQTRRIFKGLTPPQCNGLHTCIVEDGVAKFHLNGKLAMHSGEWTQSPYGQPGDRMWVKETFAYTDHTINEQPGYVFRATDPDWSEMEGFKWKPSIHMPRKASRITLEIAAVRVERLQDIKAADCIAEGIDPHTFNVGMGTVTTFRNYLTGATNSAAYQSYQSLWESINGPDSWNQNPWVWVIQFKRISP